MVASSFSSPAVDSLSIISLWGILSVGLVSVGDIVCGF